MRLHKATADDITLLGALAHKIWWAHYPSIISEAQIAYMLQRNYSAESLQRQMTDGQELWLIEDENGAMGFIGISREDAGRYFMHKFYIDPERQARGIGAAAFALLLGQYPDLRELRLLVNRQNFKSVNFYFKVGFIIETCLDTPIGEGFYMDDFRMLYRRPN